MIINGKSVSSAQMGRQARRGKNGKYINMVPCYGGCGRRVNPEGGYCSHAMTDCQDSEGRNFGDLGLILCDVCGAASANTTTVAQFISFIGQNDEAEGAHMAAIHLRGAEPCDRCGEPWQGGVRCADCERSYGPVVGDDGEEV